MICFIILAMLTLLLLSLSAHASGDKPIIPERLPKAIQQFIKTNFPNLGIRYATVDNEFFDQDYAICLSDRTKVEFDDRSRWKEINRGTNPIPATLIPRPVAEHIEKHFDKESVVKIGRRRKYFEVELKSGGKIVFDRHFNAIRAF